MSRPVLLLSAAATALGVAVPLTASAASAPAPATPFYLHSANGGYAQDFAADPTATSAPAGSTLDTTAPTGTGASATTHGFLPVGPAYPLFALPATGTVTRACVDVWAAPDGDGNLLGNVSVSVGVYAPDGTITDLGAVESAYTGGITRVSGVVEVPAGVDIAGGSALAIGGQYFDDPTDLYYDSADAPSSVTLNPTQCAGKAVDGGSGEPTPTPTATTPAPPAAGAPTYGISTSGTSAYGQAAGEPSIGFSGPTKTAWFQGGFDTMSVTVPDDGGAPAWGLASGQLTSQLISLDAIGAVDRTTGRIFDSQLVGACSLTEYSDDGAAWHQSQGCGLPHGEDHQTIGAGPFLPGGTLPRTYSDAVWYCSQANVTALCALSRDGGTTFGNGAPIYFTPTCGGIHGHVKVGPDGTPYVPNGACGGKVGIAYTKDPDNLTPWPTPLFVPDGAPRADGNDPAVGIDAANRLYVGYQGADSHPYIATHTPDGAWTKSIDVGTAFGIKNIEFATVTAADKDRAAFAFLGSTTGGDDQDPAFPGVFHLYIATTTDGGQSWTTVDATPNDPVQRGSICMAGTTCTGSTRNLLDFMDMTYDQKGRVLVAFPDGCVDACVTGGANTYANRATLAYQTGGTGLLAAFDPSEPAPVLSTTTTLAAPSTARSGSTVPVSATVVSSGGTPVASAPVVFELGSSRVTAVTDAAGKANADLPAGAAGSSTITAAYAGATGLGPSRGTSPLSVYDVRLTPTTSTSTPVSGNGSTITVKAVEDDGSLDTSWAGTPVLATTDGHHGALSCGAASAGVATCGGIVLGDLGAQTLTASAPGGYLSGSVPVTVQPTGIVFVNPPSSARSGTATTYTTAPTTGVSGASLTGYRASQTLSSSNTKDTAAAPVSCSGATCSLSITFSKGGSARTLSVLDTSTPARSARATTQVTNK